MTVMTYNSLLADIPDYLDRSNAALIAQIPNFITLAEIRCAREVKNLGYKKVVVSAFSPGNSTYVKPDRWLETISLNYGTAVSFSTTTRVAAAGTTTLTLSDAHDFIVGDSVSVFNVGGTTYNGTFTITAVTLYTISYVSGVVTEASTPDTGGTASHPLQSRTPILPRSYEYCNAYWPDRGEVDDPLYYSDYDYNNWLIVPTPQIASPFEANYFEQPMFLSVTNQTNWLTEFAPDLLLYATLLETAPYLKNDQRIPVWQDRYNASATAIDGQNRQRKNDSSIMRQE